MNNKKFFQIPVFGAQDNGQDTTLKSVVQACDAKNLGAGVTKKLDVDMKAINTDEGAEEVLPYYCSTDLCNVKVSLQTEMAEKMAAVLNEALEDLEKTGEAEAEKNEANVGGTGGAAQTTVAVATIAFSMAMACLAL